MLPDLAPGAGRARYFAVANRHAGLERLHTGSRWSGGVWKQAARDLSGALGTDNARYGGAQAKGTAILLALALGGDDEPTEAHQVLPLDAEAQS